MRARSRSLFPFMPASRPTSAAALPSLYHGGDLSWARRRNPAFAGDWLDLSTGINPWPYPLPALAAAAWARLPDAAAMERLCRAAAGAYGAASAAAVVAAPGTQALIQWLPRLRPLGQVRVLAPTYAEHAAAWRAAGHVVAEIGNLDRADDEADVVVVANPNNPDGRCHAPADLAALAGRLAGRGGWLVVDEAFADVAPELSLAGQAADPGIVVLRSFGKFFGLGGLRLGFALSAPALAARIAQALGPWAVSGPAAGIGATALADRDWVVETRARLAAAAARLDRLLSANGLAPVGGTSLFRLVASDAAPALFERLLARGILARHYREHPQWLRFGLPASEGDAARLAAALKA
jgi:cobalamin biosynthetic protein CobC